MNTTTNEQRGERRARKGRLLYVDDFSKGIRRRRCGKGFTYVSARGKTVTSKRMRKRIEALAIPPAWNDVWICARQNGHIQARGRDEAGRLQYIYHERWNALSDAAKYDRLYLLAELLPRIRRKVRADLNLRGLPKERVLAAVVRLIDKAQLRVGNVRYAEENGSRGATTLDSDHVEVDDVRVSLDFPAKSGQQRETDLTDPKIAKVIRQCEEIDGQYLFCYRADKNDYRRVDSTDVNEYLQAICGKSVTAKDFRTWWGSVFALQELSDTEPADSPSGRQKQVRAAVKSTARALGNTVAVCRKCYIHPGILAAAESGELAALVKKASAAGESRRELTSDENALADLLPHLDFT